MVCFGVFLWYVDGFYVWGDAVSLSLLFNHAKLYDSKCECRYVKYVQPWCYVWARAQSLFHWCQSYNLSDAPRVERSCSFFYSPHQHPFLSPFISLSIITYNTNGEDWNLHIICYRHSESEKRYPKLEVFVGEEESCLCWYVYMVVCLI